MKLNDDYYCWLLDRIGALQEEYSNYETLLQYLYFRVFEYTLVMDANRAAGGQSLRAIYADSTGIYAEDVKDGPCTILEMLVALAEHMRMYAGDDICKWFWEMLGNLKLLANTDDAFDEEDVTRKIDIWLNRDYDSCGNGSIFPLGDDFPGNAKSMEIWNQMHKYLTTKYPVGNWIE